MLTETKAVGDRPQAESAITTTTTMAELLKEWQRCHAQMRLAELDCDEDEEAERIMSECGKRVDEIGGLLLLHQPESVDDVAGLLEVAIDAQQFEWEDERERRLLELARRHLIPIATSESYERARTCVLAERSGRRVFA